MNQESLRLGTSTISNALIDQFFPAALAGTMESPEFQSTVSDAACLSAVRFLYRRYLPGQCGVAITAQETAWLSRAVAFEEDPKDLTPLLVCVLRGTLVRPHGNFVLER